MNSNISLQVSLLTGSPRFTDSNESNRLCSLLMKLSLQDELLMTGLGLKLRGQFKN